MLLAAQEPPTLQLLAAAWSSTGLPLPQATGGATEGSAAEGSCCRMRMDDARVKAEERLQLLGSLYAVRDGGRVCVFHTSFHDFLLKPKLASGKANTYRCNPLPGHVALAAVAVPLASAAAAKALGLQLPPLPLGGNADADSSSSSSSSLANYALCYVTRHLVAVSNDTMGDDPCLKEAGRGALSELLADFDFVAAAFNGGHGHELIRAVVELAEPRSPEVADAVRWLLERQLELFNAKDVSEVVDTALRCPHGSLVLQRAQAWVREQAAAAGGSAGCCGLAGAGASGAGLVREHAGHQGRCTSSRIYVPLRGMLAAHRAVLNGAVRVPPTDTHSQLNWDGAAHAKSRDACRWSTTTGGNSGRAGLGTAAWLTMGPTRFLCVQHRCHLQTDARTVARSPDSCPVANEVDGVVTLVNQRMHNKATGY